MKKIYKTVAAVVALGVLAACELGAASTQGAFPMAEVQKFDQARPTAPVLGAAFLSTAEVLPQAVQQAHAPLPAAVPLQGAASLSHILANAQSMADAMHDTVRLDLATRDSGWAGQHAWALPATATATAPEQAQL